MNLLIKSLLVSGILTFGSYGTYRTLHGLNRNDKEMTTDHKGTNPDSLSKNENTNRTEKANEISAKEQRDASGEVEDSSKSTNTLDSSNPSEEQKQGDQSSTHEISSAEETHNQTQTSNEPDTSKDVQPPAEVTIAKSDGSSQPQVNQQNIQDTVSIPQDSESENGKERKPESAATQTVSGETMSDPEKIERETQLEPKNLSSEEGKQAISSSVAISSAESAPQLKLDSENSGIKSTQKDVSRTDSESSDIQTHTKQNKNNDISQSAPKESIQKSQ